MISFRARRESLRNRRQHFDSLLRRRGYALLAAKAIESMAKRLKTKKISGLEIEQ
jgi:hypothetical protein